MKQQIYIISNAIHNYNYSAQLLKSNEFTLSENIAKFNNFSTKTNSKLEMLNLKHNNYTKWRRSSGRQFCRSHKY